MLVCDVMLRVGEVAEMTDVIENVKERSAWDAAEAVVARLERAQQTGDVEALVGLFHRDAVWVTAKGKPLIGRDAIAEFTARVLPGAMQQSTATYRVANVVMIRLDVLVVSVDQTPVTLKGTALTGVTFGKPTYVMVRQGHEWVIIAGQNIHVSA